MIMFGIKIRGRLNLIVVLFLLIIRDNIIINPFQAKCKPLNKFYVRFICQFTCLVDPARDRICLSFKDLITRSMVLVERPVVAAGCAMEMPVSAIMDFSIAVSFSDRHSGSLPETSV